MKIELERNSVRALAACLLALSMGLSARAEAFPWIVREGETLAGIARGMYGRVENEKLLVSANGLDEHGGVAIAAGMRLEIPAVTHRRVERGDTWPELAAALLGDRRRAAVLAFANGSKPWLLPTEKAEVRVPYNLRYVAAGGETLPGVASRFYGSQKRAMMLQHYNAIDHATLERGELLLLPLTDLALTDAGRAAAAAAQDSLRGEAGGAARAVQARVDERLPRLLSHIRAGRYVEAVALGIELERPSALTAPQQAVLQRQLVEAYVALDAPARASRACRAWLRSDPHAQLDPTWVSPKVLAACRAAE